MMGDIHSAEMPNHAKYSTRSVSPRRSPYPSPSESWTDRT